MRALFARPMRALFARPMRALFARPMRALFARPMRAFAAGELACGSVDSKQPASALADRQALANKPSQIGRDL
jgi:hypothetical protein